MEPVTLTVGEEELTLAEIKAWDLIQARREVRDGNGNVDNLEFGLAMTWRSACAGGYKKSFKDFCCLVPATQLDVIVEAAKPFFSKAEPEPSA